jgi:hypothetical protein
MGTLGYGDKNVVVQVRLGQMGEEVNPAADSDGHLPVLCEEGGEEGVV